MRETASYEPSCVKISSVVFPVEDGQEKKEESRKKVQKIVALVAELLITFKMFALVI